MNVLIVWIEWIFDILIVILLKFIVLRFFSEINIFESVLLVIFVIIECIVVESFFFLV